MFKNRTIAVDVDDVIAAHIEDFIRYSNEQYGTDITPATYSNDWPSLWGISHEEMQDRARKFHESSVANFRVIEDAQPVLKRLSEKYTLVVVTARPAYNLEATNSWINQHFDNVFQETHFVPVWEKHSKATKAEVCKQIGADYLIDDSPEHCNVAAEAGITSLLFGSYEWVRNHEVHPDVVTVANWNTVEGYFNGKN